MINVIEGFSLCLIIILCFLCTKSDLDRGIIQNKILAVFFILASILDAVYYGVFVRDLFYEFIINFFVVSIVSLYLFYSHSFAGGDCKMSIVLAMLFPARCYVVVGESNITLILTIAFAIFAGYCYLLMNSLWSIVRKKVTITFAYIKKSLINFLKSYVAAMIYISFFYNILMLCSNYGFEINIWIIRFLCLLVAWCVGKFQVFKKGIVFVPVAFIVFVISIVTKTSPVSLNIENYFLVLILLFCQMMITTIIYEKIAVKDLEKGMILSTFSSLMMQTSITKGLPGISTEDLKSRLTTEEVESIKIWAKATRIDDLTIVKKIPFAIFISIGFISYFILWGILI